MKETANFLYCDVCQQVMQHNDDDECLSCIADCHKEVEDFDTPPYYEHPDDCDCEHCDMESGEFYSNDEYDEA